MLSRFLFICFNLYFPSGAHLCTFSRRWADKEWLFGCWGSSLYANTEEPLLSSREMFNMFLFQNKVCVSHPQCLSTTKWKQTEERWDSSHPWVLLLPSDTPYRAHLCLLHPNPSFLIGLKGFVFNQDKRGAACQEVWWPNHDHSRDAPCGTGVSPQLAALQGWGGFMCALVTLHHEGHRAAGVLSLFCLGLVPFPLSSDCLSVPPRGRKLFFLSSSHDLSLDRPLTQLWHLVSTAEEAFPSLRKTLLLSYLYL